MKFSIKNRTFSFTISQLIYLGLLIVSVLLCLFCALTNKREAVSGLCFWMVFLLIGYISRPRSDMHRILMGTLYEKLLTLLIAALTIFYCVAPMGRLPLWNGEDPGHRNQYELLAESFLEGKLYIEYGDEEELLTLENPYDRTERRESGVRYHWDHAFYNGRYYMYFGVVPVLLVFLPYRVLTGTSLTTYHATQLFSILLIIGFFCLFRLLAKLFFKKLSFGMYLLMSAAFSMISVWYATSSPALYCTAITAGLCMQLWSIYFFCKGVWDCEEENTQLRYAFVGALLGALTFGCRPPIGLANILVLPLLYTFLKQRTVTPKLIGKLCLAALPYLVVAIGLMAYNYARFDNILEFGQSYQLTVADQRELGKDISFVKVYNATIQNFFYFSSLKEEFPNITHSGLFFNFPIFLFLFSGIIPDVWNNIREKKLVPFFLTLVAAMVLITVADVIGSPYLLERYRMDIYFLAAIACFLMIGAWHETAGELCQKRSCIIMHLCLFTMISTIFHYFYEVSINYSELIADLEPVIFFWRYL